MEWQELFAIKGKKQREREREAYSRRIFHLGEGHREAVARLLGIILREKKEEEQQLYAYICAKDCWLQDQEKGGEHLKEWYEKTYRYPEDKRKLIMLIEKEAKLENLAAYSELEKQLKD